MSPNFCIFHAKITVKLLIGCHLFFIAYVYQFVGIPRETNKKIARRLVGSISMVMYSDILRTSPYSVLFWALVFSC